MPGYPYAPSPPRATRRSNGDKSRRARWLDAVAKAPVSRGARAWALTLAQRSSATGKPVWGRQTGQAREIGCSDRQVRRYRVELEAVGLIDTRRAPVERDRATGRIARVMTNLYIFVVAPLTRKSSSYRPDIGGRSNLRLSDGYKPTRPNIGVKVVISDPHFDPGDFGDDDVWQMATV